MKTRAKFKGLFMCLVIMISPTHSHLSHSSTHPFTHIYPVLVLFIIELKSPVFDIGLLALFWLLDKRHKKSFEKFSWN